jgi:transcriptional regulator with XRE-family HTH domain
VPRDTSPDPAAINRAFGTALGEARREAGLSQEQLAHDCGSGRTYISELERGVKNASVAMVFRLAHALHCAPSDLLTATERALGHTNRRR